MSEDIRIDITSVEGQAALLMQTRQAIDDIGAVAASSPDDSVRVWVNAQGAVMSIELDDTIRRLDPDDLARLITATAQHAAYNAAERVTEALTEVDKLRTEMLEELSELDPNVAEILRTLAEKSRPENGAASGPFDFL